MKNNGNQNQKNVRDDKRKTCANLESQKGYIGAKVCKVF